MITWLIAYLVGFAASFLVCMFKRWDVGGALLVSSIWVAVTIACIGAFLAVNIFQPALSRVSKWHGNDEKRTGIVMVGFFVVIPVLLALVKSAIESLF